MESLVATAASGNPGAWNWSILEQPQVLRVSLRTTGLQPCIKQTHIGVS
jgi:hypothetical protein